MVRGLSIFVTFLLSVFVNAQSLQELEANYVEALGDYLGLYRGKLEVPYDKTTYRSSPYLHDNDGFVKGSIFYGGTHYSDVMLRLDLYTNSLIVLSPNAGKKIVVRKDLVDSFSIGAENFMNLDGIYVREEYLGRKLSLYTHILKKQDVPDMQSARRMLQFKTKEEILLFVGFTRHVIKGYKDIVSLFPERKTEIEKLVDKEHLKFSSQDKVNSLTRIVQILER